MAEIPRTRTRPNEGRGMGDTAGIQDPALKARIDELQENILHRLRQEVAGSDLTLVDQTGGPSSQEADSPVSQFQVQGEVLEEGDPSCVQGGVAS